MLRNVTPFLRWAGSKRQILSELEPFALGYRRYIEPFVGSACLFFRLAPTAAILGDLNAELISTYEVVRDDPAALHNLLMHYRRGEREYKRIRSLDPGLLSKEERAARFVYLNRFCFNGLYRTNLTGQFNVPYGGGKSGEVPTIEHLIDCSAVLRRARLINGSFERTLALARPGDFVYMDPPFSVRARRVFKEYNSAIFSDQDLLRLREWMERLADSNISFLVSYADSSEANSLANGFQMRTVSVRRHIAGSFSNRVRSAEVLINFTARN